MFNPLAIMKGRRPDLPWEIHRSTGERWGVRAWGWVYERFTSVESGREVGVPVQEIEGGR